MSDDESDDGPYLSHPVRRLLEEGAPVPRAPVELAVEPGEDATVDLESIVSALDGTVSRRGRFTTVVRLPVENVAAFVDRTGEELERIETADTLGLGLDPDLADEDPTAPSDADGTDGTDHDSSRRSDER
jgi:hypothetical protein